MRPPTPRVAWGLGRMTGPRRTTNPQRLGLSRDEVAGRRRLYAEARDAGMTVYQAAREAGVDEVASGPRYERWYQAGREAINHTLKSAGEVPS